MNNAHEPAYDRLMDDCDDDWRDPSAMVRLGIDGLGYVLRQYRDDVMFNSTLDKGQKDRRIAMIEAAMADFGEDE
jgi:hypothetical protein